MLSLPELRAREAAILRQLHTIKLAHHPELSSELSSFQQELRGVLQGLRKEVHSADTSKQAMQELTAEALAAKRSAA